MTAPNSETLQNRLPRPRALYRLTLYGAVGCIFISSYWLIARQKPTNEYRFNWNAFDSGSLADAGFYLASQFTGPIADPTSLADLKSALQCRSATGIAKFETELANLPQKSPEQKFEAAKLHYMLAKLFIYEGRLDEALQAAEKSLEIGRRIDMPDRIQFNLTALMGIISLRHGEIANCVQCVGPSSCILPIDQKAVHTNPDGSRQAIGYFTKCLKSNPKDLRIRWLLNLAYMTLGEHPDQVPREFLIPLDVLASTSEIGRFTNVATLAGLTARGPNQAGGSVFDDFTGDGLPDLLTTSLDYDRGASLFVNLGNGKFEDRSEAAGLGQQIYALNAVHADFDNDGRLDVLLLRGGWESKMRMSLLRNVGEGVFEDVTIESGLEIPITTESAAWGDYDNDGLVDLFVCGEYRTPARARSEKPADPDNLCRLYHNLGNGNFVNVADELGVADDQCAKGCAWGDYDGDGRLDLYVSNMNTPCRLFHQEPDGKFRDVAQELGVTGPSRPFACWFWDFDNDGRLDLYVNDYQTTLLDFVGDLLQDKQRRIHPPALYRNLGESGFRDIAREVGLERNMNPMGVNFADLDNDGFLDLYLGTGAMDLESLVPNTMLKNQAGQRFEDVTINSGTGHLQKGHGVSFADWDGDGDLDLFVEVGGAVPGDRSYNLLFENPGHGRHWLKLKLVGTRTNQAALGAKVTAIIQETDGSTRCIYRTVGNNSSFGGNSLVVSLGLATATSVSELQISWPATGQTQTFRHVAADQAIIVTEGTDEYTLLSQSSNTGSPQQSED